MLNAMCDLPESLQAEFEPDARTAAKSKRQLGTEALDLLGFRERLSIETREGGTFTWTEEIYNGPARWLKAALTTFSEDHVQLELSFGDRVRVVGRCDADILPLFVATGQAAILQWKGQQS